MWDITHFCVASLNVVQLCGNWLINKGVKAYQILVSLTGGLPHSVLNFMTTRKSHLSEKLYKEAYPHMAYDCEDHNMHLVKLHTKS